jgi:hypothetical protein
VYDIFLTGFLCFSSAVLAAVLCLSFILTTNCLLALPPAMVLGKVYSNAMMVNFNHRIQLAGGRNDTQITSFIQPSQILFPDSVVANDESASK